MAKARAAHEIKIFVIESFFPEEYLFYLFYAVQLSGPSRIGISIEDTAAMVWPSFSNHFEVSLEVSFEFGRVLNSV